MCVGDETAPAGTVIVSPVARLRAMVPDASTSKLQLRLLASPVWRRTGRMRAPDGLLTTPNGGAPSTFGETSVACSPPHATSAAAATTTTTGTAMERFHIMRLSVGRG